MSQLKAPLGRVLAPSPGLEAQTGPQRRGAWLAALAAALVLGIGLWWLWPQTAAGQALPRPKGVGFPTEWVGAQALPPVVRGAPSASAVSLRAPRAEMPVGPLACGLPARAVGVSEGGSAPAPAGQWGPERIAAAVRTRERLRAAFELSSDELARAAALLLPRVSLQLSSPAVASEQALEEARRIETQVQAQAMAHQALSTRSSLVYGLAWKWCQATQQGSSRDAHQGSACQMLSLEQWAHLDPGNAVPWLELALQAQERGNAAGVDEAMFRASRAKSVDAGFDQLSALVFTRAPSDVSLFDAWTASGELSAWSVSWSLAPYRMASQYCEPKRLADANLRQHCVDLADLFERRATRLMDLALAHSLGQRLGWSSERLDALQLQRDALAAVLWQQRPALAQSQADCATLGREREHLLAVAQRGELALARERLSASGKSLQAWAGERRPAAAPASASALEGAPRSAAEPPRASALRGAAPNPGGL